LLKISNCAVIAGLLSAGLVLAQVRAPNTSLDPDRPPELKTESGIVRVWNAKNEPPVERDHTPEAQRGDAIVVELKNLDHWLSDNLQAGAWPDDETVKDAGPLVQQLIKDRQLTTAIKAAEQLEVLARESSMLYEQKNEGNQSAAADLSALATDPDVVEQLGYVEWGDYHPKDENGTALNPENAQQAAAIIEQCETNLNFIRNFARARSATFVLAVNDLALPGLVVETPEREAGWRTEDVAALELVRPVYRWYQFRLQGRNNSDFGKAWTRLMQSAGTHFSNPSKVALSLPGQKSELFTNVRRDSQDPRCRFNLLAVATAAPTPGQNQFKKNDAVYPLDERDLEGHVLKARVVEEPDLKSDTPYLVHFEEKGGTRRYAGNELARLPPDLVPIGVVRVWNGNDPRLTEWEDAQIDDTPRAKLRDTLAVELRNFEDWLARQIDNGFFQDDPLLLKASQASKPLDELIKAKRFAATARVGEIIQHMIDDSPHIRPSDIVEKLERAAKSDPTLATIKFSSSPEHNQQHAPVENSRGPTATATPATSPAKTLAAPTPPPREQTDAEKEKAKEEHEAQKEAIKTQQDRDAQVLLAPYEEVNAVLDELVATKLRSLILTINDIALGIVPDNADFSPVAQTRRPAGDPKDDTYYWLHYSLKAKSSGLTADEAKAAEEPFKRLLAHPSFTMPSKVTLTLKSGSETLTLPTAVTTDAADHRACFALIGIEPIKFWPMVVVFVLILGSLAFFAASTDILRDPSRRRPEGVEPVSLARTQMAFWFVVIAAAFAFLWVTTGNVDTINGTCLTLLAIGTTTALTTLAVQGDRSSQKDLSTVLQKTPHEMLRMRPSEIKEAIAQRKAELETAGSTSATPDEVAAQKAILVKQEQEIDQLAKQRPKWLPRRIYFWRYRLRTVFEDLLTEQAGTYDFHRFQMLAWTLVLGSVFVAKVFSDRAMPQFDSNLLLLMGISSGAYIGFKMANPKKDDDPPKDDAKPDTPKPA
jgi:hypothetical protein